MNLGTTYNLQHLFVSIYKVLSVDVRELSDRKDDNNDNDDDSDGDRNTDSDHHKF